MSPCHHLLLQAVTHTDSRALVLKAEKIIREEKPDWNDLLMEAEVHSVKPQLAGLLVRLDKSMIPEWFREKINSEHREVLVAQMGFVSEFLMIRKKLSDAGIVVVPFKGFWLASEYYGNLGDRESVDIDLFVKEDDLVKIAALMPELGYTPQAGFQPYSIEDIKKNFHEYNFDRFSGEDRVSHVEFHWKMSIKIYGMDITMDELSSEVRKGKLQGNEIECFSPSANLLLTIMHHGGRDLFRDLKQVLDISRLIHDHDIEWERLINLADRYRVTNLLFVGVRLAADLTAVEIPDYLREGISSRKIKSLSENRKKALSKAAENQNQLRLGFDRWLFRMRSLRGVFFKMKLSWFILMLLLTNIIVPAKMRKYFPYSAVSSSLNL